MAVVVAGACGVRCVGLDGSVPEEPSARAKRVFAHSAFSNAAVLSLVLVLALCCGMI